MPSIGLGERQRHGDVQDVTEMIGIIMLLASGVFTVGAYLRSWQLIWSAIICAVGVFISLFFKKPKPNDWAVSSLFYNFVIGGVAPYLLVYSYIFGRLFECLLFLMAFWFIEMKTYKSSSNKG